MIKAIVIISQLAGSLLPAMAIAADIHGRLDLGSGYQTHPLGLREETAAGYLDGVLLLNAVFASQAHTFRFGYEGTAVSFGRTTDLGSRRYALGVEWSRGADGRRGGLSAGVQVSERDHDGAYGVYDYGEGEGYLAFRRYLGDRTLGRGHVALRVRDYGELPEESFREVAASLEIQRFAENRTTLGLSLRYGVKSFDDPVAPRVWGTPETPATAQLAARFHLARGLSARAALRGWIEGLWSLSDFPHYVADDVYDSPVLDRYAYEGADSGLVLKVLAPWQTWLEIGGTWGNHDYGEMVFADGNAGSLRRDTVLGAFATLQRVLGTGLGRPQAKLLLGWRDQDSSLAGYDYVGALVDASLSWAW